MPTYDGYGIPRLDFSGLAQIPQDRRQAQAFEEQQRILEARKRIASDPNMPPDQVAKLLFASGDIQGANAAAGLGDRDYRRSTDARDFSFRQQEAQRAQGNADRSFGLQRQQLDATLEGTKVPPGWQKTETGIAPIPEGPADPAYIERASRAKMLESGILDDDTLRQMASQYRAGDTSVLTNLGRGNQGAANVVKLRKEIARQNGELGESGTEQAVRNAEYFGTKAGQRTLGTRTANIELAATEFQQVLPVVQEASRAVSRTQYPDLNRIIQAYNEKTGDPNIVKFGGGVNTLINLYARAISPTGVPTVSDKDHAREILNRAWSQGQFDAAVGMMRQEIGAALQSPEKVRDEMRKRFLGGVPGRNPQGGGGGAPDPLGIR